MESDSLIEARNVSVETNSKKLLDAVSLELKTGETLAVVGANGAGKSTLRKVLCGDLELSGGAVLMNGKRLSEWSLIKRAKVRAVMEQDSSLGFPFTVLEVVLMGRSPHVVGTESPLDYAIARETLQAVEAEHLAERLYPTLSGGERQRVQLARTLAQIWENTEDAPRYLLLDEPTSNLDLAHQHSTLEIARRFAAAGAGVLVILHDLNLAAQYADRVVILKNGKLTASGAPSDVFTPETIREAFDFSVLVIEHPVLGCPLIVPSRTADFRFTNSI